MVQVLIHNAIYESGPDSFVGIRQAAIYAMMYWGTARFEEVKEVELRQICKKGASLEIKILKGKKNQTRKLQRCVIHPNSLYYQWRICPVDLIDSYLVHRNNLGHNSDHDYIFPQVGTLTIKEILCLYLSSYPKSSLKFCPQVQEIPLGKKLQ